ncbi:UNVERIFIED_CONTAM: hypothetical protein PYX00_006574 [Menopon gallinae]|uniref:Carboxylesterase type B domain-containing protein n=1 Tax=Menopon gallinae TaxID=328185 RepID=A0AAW2HVT7_9NEOP
MSVNSVVVEIAAGLLRGLKVKTVYGAPYFSFKGIPYGTPPLGELRFKPPKPIAPWTGIRDAFKEGNVAPQFDMVTKQYIESSSEDCLYLNVYTKSIPDEKSKTGKLPVMFYIHGGGFTIGSGDAEYYGPDFLVTQDVVLVTCNYRLGPLGFLSLGTKDYPGNNGLKDIVLALKWVQENIAKFSGDPGNVTVFGESAGGAAVEFLAISKSTKNLFHKAIVQSGSTLCPWAFTERGREFAFCLGELLGCKTEDDKTLVDFLRKVPAQQMIAKAKEIIPKLVPGEKFERSAFLVVAEPESEDCILSKHPYDALVAGDFHDIPLINGHVDSEGILFLDDGIPTLKKDEDFERFIPINTPKKISKEIIKKVKNFYFPDGFSESGYIRVLSAKYFLNGIYTSIDSIRKNPTRQSPIYSYVFSFEGENGFYKRLMKLQNYSGVCHCDELGYLFRVCAMSHCAREGSKEYEMIRTMTKLWSNFARTGDPNDGDIPTAWKPMTAKEKNYLDIGESLAMKKDFAAEEVDFWREISQQIRNCQ